MIRFGLEPLPATPATSGAIIIGGSIATHLKLLEALDSIIERSVMPNIRYIVYGVDQLKVRNRPGR